DNCDPGEPRIPRSLCVRPCGRHRPAPGERRSAPGFRVPLVPAVPMAAIALNLALGALLWNYPARSDAPIPPGTFAALLGGVWLAVGLAYHWIGGLRTAGRPASANAATE